LKNTIIINLLMDQYTNYEDFSPLHTYNNKNRKSSLSPVIS